MIVHEFDIDTDGCACARALSLRSAEVLVETASTRRALSSNGEEATSQQC